MDEEQEILQSSLEQSDKISINSFFGSPIGGLANRALTQSNQTLKASSINRDLIQTLQSSIELLKSQVQQITNYFVIDKQERSKILKQRKTEDFEKEDDEQKGLVSPQKTQLKDSAPFFPEARFSQGLTAGMSSIGEKQGVAKFQERFIGGSKSFFFGGLVPGEGNADTVNAKLTPGEFVIPKDKVEEFTPNFLSGLIKAGSGENTSKNTSKLPPSQREGSKSNRLIKNLRNKSESVNPFKVEDTNTPDFSLLTAVSALEGGDSQARVDVAQSMYNRLNEVKKDIGDGPGTTAITDYTRDSFVSDESGVFPEPTLSDIILKNKQYQPTYKDPTKNEGPETVVSDEFLNVSNKETAIQAMKSYYDKRGDERSMEDIESLYDQTVIDLQDQKLNKNAAAFVGGRTEFRGGTPSDEAIVSGTDIDRGDGLSGDPDNKFFIGKEKQKDGSFKTLGTGTQLETGPAISPLIKNPLKDVEAGAVTEVSDEEAKKLIQAEEGENPLTNMISSFTKKSEEGEEGENPLTNMISSFTKKSEEGENPLANMISSFTKKSEEGEEGENPLANMLSPLTKKLESFTKSDTAKNLKNMADTDALGLENMANKASEVIGGKEGLESLKNDIISIVGNQLLNKITSDKEDKEDKKVDFSVSPSQSEEVERDITPDESSGKVVQPASSGSETGDITSNESIKEAAQSLMTPPLPPQSETIEAPPQVQGDDGGGGNIAGSAPSFNPSTPSHDELTGTESPLIFIEVISNPFLSIP